MNAAYRIDPDTALLFGEADAYYAKIKDSLTSADLGAKTEPEVERWLVSGNPTRPQRVRVRHQV